MKLRENAQKAKVLPEYFLCEIESISDTCLTLSTLLYSRGLGQDKVYQLVSDVIRVVDSTCFCNLSYVNHSLESLGWPGRILDETSFELIQEIVCSVFDYQAEVFTVH